MSQKQELITKYLDLARAIAISQWKTGLLRGFGDVDDAIQEASLALIQAVEHYDETHASQNPRAYFGRCIVNHLKLHQKTGGLVRTPGWRLRRVTRETRPEVYKAAKQLRGTMSIHSRDGDDNAFNAVLAKKMSYSENPSARLEAEEARAAFKRLAPDQQNMLKRRLGLDGNDCETLRVLAEEGGVSHECARLRQLSALNDLRKMLVDDEPEANYERKAGDDSGRDSKPATNPEPTDSIGNVVEASRGCEPEVVVSVQFGRVAVRSVIAA